MHIDALIKKFDTFYVSQTSVLKNNIIITVNDISIFDISNTTKRNNNDKNNKLRENIIQCVINNEIPKYWFHRCEIWSNFRYNLLHYIGSIQDKKYQKVSCVLKGGRKFNYDFDIKYQIGDEELVKKVEFKFGCNEIQKCPQFLSLQAKSISEYPEYFYDNYISKISKLVNTVNPKKEIYLKYVNSVKYDKDPWFKTLYDNEDRIKEEKKDIVDESISKYISIFAKNINIETVKEKILNSQTDKIYMCYDGNFHKDYFSKEDMTIIKISGFKKNKKNHITSIIFETKTDTKIIFLLRWRNRSGILNPAWQISIKRKN